MQKGVKGIGCGVTSKTEGKDIAFFGYKAMCESWIYAIAAAIKSADLFVSFMRYDVMVVHVTYINLSLNVLERWFQWQRSQYQ